MDPPKKRGDEMRRKLEALGLEVTLTTRPEDTRPEDHFSDPRDARLVRKRIAAGREWGWAIVCVEVKDPRTGAKGVDFLGGCSYLDEADFRRCDDYWLDMIRNAYDEVRRQLDAWANPVPNAEAARILATLPAKLP